MKGVLVLNEFVRNERALAATFGRSPVIPLVPAWIQACNIGSKRQETKTNPFIRWYVAGDHSIACTSIMVCRKHATHRGQQHQQHSKSAILVPPNISQHKHSQPTTLAGIPPAISTAVSRHAHLMLSLDSDLRPRSQHGRLSSGC